MGAAFLLPIGVFIDFLRGEDRVFKAYLWAEDKCRQPLNAVLLIALVVLNWIWTIFKGL